MPSIKPWMTQPEIDAVIRNIMITDTMLEWGSGGSTLLFPKYVKEYYSIEHDTKWWADLYNKVDKNVFLYLAPPEYPYEGNCKPAMPGQFSRYVTRPATWNGPTKFDVVLIDGRDRAACAMFAYYNLLTKDSVVFFHDFTPERMYRYGSVLTHFEIIEQVEKLAIMKPRRLV